VVSFAARVYFGPEWLTIMRSNLPKYCAKSSSDMSPAQNCAMPSGVERKCPRSALFRPLFDTEPLADQWRGSTPQPRRPRPDNTSHGSSGRLIGGGSSFLPKNSHIIASIATDAPCGWRRRSWRR
jgi:hypothetical protein